MYVCLYQKRFTDKGSNDTGSNDIGSNDKGSNDTGSNDKGSKNATKGQIFLILTVSIFLLLFRIRLGTFWAERCG